jgi:hypothetical protein
MKSYEVIRNAVDEPGVKRVAAELRVSQALVYKWCEPPAEEKDSEQSGTRNPLDRVRDLYLLTRDIGLVRWLCNEAGGFYVPNPIAELHRDHEASIFSHTRQLMQDFSQLLDAVHQSLTNDNSVDAHEADQIRQRWEDLKAVAEEFVIDCERGQFDRTRK